MHIGLTALAALMARYLFLSPLPCLGVFVVFFLFRPFSEVVSAMHRTMRQNLPKTSDKT